MNVFVLIVAMPSSYDMEITMSMRRNAYIQSQAITTSKLASPVMPPIRDTAKYRVRYLTVASSGAVGPLPCDHEGFCPCEETGGCRCGPPCFCAKKPLTVDTGGRFTPHWRTLPGGVPATRYTPAVAGPVAPIYHPSSFNPVATWGAGGNHYGGGFYQPMGFGSGFGGSMCGPGGCGR